MAYAAADPPETSFAIPTSVVWSGRHNEDLIARLPVLGRRGAVIHVKTLLAGALSGRLL